MATHNSAATVARIEAAWSDLIAAVAAGRRMDQACEAASLMPDQVRVYRVTRPEREREWQSARKQSAEAFADKVLEILEGPIADGAVARAKMDGWKWLASKRDPASYSDKQQVDINVKHVDLTRIIEAANARILAGRAPVTIEHNTGEHSASRALDHARAQGLLPAPGELADLL